MTEYVYKSENVPSAFDGMRIVQVSDLHDAMFGENNEALITKVRGAKPDAIFITGDVIDSNRYDLEQSMEAVRGFVEIADVYYVLGNHEVATNQVSTIYETLVDAGVRVLANDAVVLEQQGEKLAIVGIEDQLMNPNTAHMLDQALNSVPANSLTVLLAHRPEMIRVYADYGMDIVFSGHAHGGQFRIPGLGGLIAPGQGWLPTYTAGMYEREKTSMVVSRGLGNSGVSQRLFNLPEVVVVQLQQQ